MRWQIEDAPDDQDAAVISDGVFRFGRMEAHDSDARPIACFLRSGADILAGATGRTEYQRLFVNYLWVRDDLRGRGFGSEALGRIEAAAIERGCRDALIETLSERNAVLYRRLGYAPLAVINRCVGSFNRHILLKTF